MNHMYVFIKMEYIDAELELFKYLFVCYRIKYINRQINKQHVGCYVTCWSFKMIFTLYQFTYLYFI